MNQTAEEFRMFFHSVEFGKLAEVVKIILPKYHPEGIKDIHSASPKFQQELMKQYACSCEEVNSNFLVDFVAESFDLKLAVFLVNRESLWDYAARAVIPQIQEDINTALKLAQ